MNSRDKLKSLYLHYPIATKRDSRVVYRKGLRLIKLHDPLITLVCDIMWLIKIPLVQCLKTQNLASWWLKMRCLHLSRHMTIQTSSLVRSRNKLNTCISTSIWPISTKLGKVVTYHDRFLPLNFITLWSPDQFVFSDNLKNLYILATKLGRKVASGRRLKMQAPKLSPISCLFWQNILHWKKKSDIYRTFEYFIWEVHI